MKRIALMFGIVLSIVLAVLISSTGTSWVITQAERAWGLRAAALILGGAALALCFWIAWLLTRDFDR